MGLQEAHAAVKKAKREKKLAEYELRWTSVQNEDLDTELEYLRRKACIITQLLVAGGRRPVAGLHVEAGACLGAVTDVTSYLLPADKADD